MTSERKPDGTFATGHAGGPGRPKRATEAARLAILNEVVTADDWRQICEKAKDDAINCFEAKDRDKGRRFIADYVIGRPRQSINVTSDEDAWTEDFDDLTDAELEAIAAGTKPGGPGAGPADPGRARKKKN